MVRLIRSAVPKYTDMQQALQAAKAVAAYVKEKYGADIHVFADTVGTLYWISDYADFTAFGNARVQILADKTYWDLATKVAEHLTEGTLQDRILNPV
jgi:hypothetical protein